MSPTAPAAAPVAPKVKAKAKPKAAPVSIFLIAGVAEVLGLEWPTVADYHEKGVLRSSFSVLGDGLKAKPAFTPANVAAFRDHLLARWSVLAEANGRDRYAKLSAALKARKIPGLR